MFSFFFFLVERVFRVQSRINNILISCGTSVPDIFTFSENIGDMNSTTIQYDTNDYE